MTQYTIKDYVALITKLLQCPEGEEWALLHRYQYLVNHELLEVLEQISQNFMRQGDSVTAQTLHQWAIEIQQSLPPQTRQKNEPLDQDRYDELIQLLLDYPEGYESTILTQHRAMIDQTLLDRMRKVAQIMADKGESEHAQYLMDLAAQIHQILNPGIQGEDSAIASTPVDQDSPELSREGLAEETPIAIQLAPSPQGRQEQVNETSASTQLDSLLQSLNQLTGAIANQTKSASSFSYLDILEKAQAHEWLLSTHEIQTIIGTKPHCSTSNPEYHHGGWRFVKCGQVGRNLLWQVFKLKPSDVISAEQKSDVGTEFSLPLLALEADPWTA